MTIPIDPVVMSTESHGKSLSNAQARSPGFHAQHRLVYNNAGISQACVHKPTMCTDDTLHINKNCQTQKKSAAVIEKVALLEHSELGFSVCGTDNVNTNGRHKCIPVCQIVWFTATSKKVRQSNVEDSTIKAHARKLLVKTNTLAIFLLLHGCLVFSTANKILDPLHSEAAVALTLTCVANSPLVTLLLMWFCYLRCLT